MTDSSDHPPRPGLVFRVGVVGHRWDRMGPPVETRAGVGPEAATAALEDQLTRTCSRLLSEIADVVGAVAAGGIGYRDRTATLAVVSGLAEGADRIVAWAGLGLGYQLWTILPFAEDAYRKDFDGRWGPGRWSRPGAADEFDALVRRESRRLVMDGVPGRYDAYVPLGRAVLHHADLLIAIWDEDPAAGPGGTTEILALARQAEVPILRIDPAVPNVGWLENRRVPDQGLSGRTAGLGRRIRSLIEAPASGDLRESFFRERQVRGHLGKAYAVMTGYVAGWRWFGRLFGPTFPAWLRVLVGLFRPEFREPCVARTRRRWEEQWSGERPVDATLRNRLASSLAPLYGWADHLAEYYANRYRSAFTAVFSLAWVAAVVAVVGFVAQVSGYHRAAVAAAWIELGTVALLFGLTSWGQLRKFHEKWIDYRTLAERVRHLTIIWPTASTTPFTRMAESPPPDDPRNTWIGWLFRATVRELGFGAERFSAMHLESCRRLLRDHEIEHQRAYHHATALRLERIHHAVHWRTNWLFGLAVIVAFLHLPRFHEALTALIPPIGRLDPELWGGAVLTVLSVFLPARAAALHGWAGHADFFGAALRSAAIEARLQELARVADAMGEMDSRLLGELAADVARAMESELLAWHAVSRSKPLQHV